MTQIPLIHEDFMHALTTCVGVLGGAKRVGVMLRPEYEDEPDKAARWLLACLNPARDEKLTWEQTFKIMRESKAVGCHVAMAFITQHVGYADPQPIEPEDEKAKLRREFVEGVRRLEKLSSRLEALS